MSSSSSSTVKKKPYCHRPNTTKETALWETVTHRRIRMHPIRSVFLGWPCMPNPFVFFVVVVVAVVVVVVVVAVVVVVVVVDGGGRLFCVCLLMLLLLMPCSTLQYRYCPTYSVQYTLRIRYRYTCNTKTIYERHIIIEIQTKLVHTHTHTRWRRRGEWAGQTFLINYLRRGEGLREALIPRWTLFCMETYLGQTVGNFLLWYRESIFPLFICSSWFMYAYLLDGQLCGISPVENACRTGMSVNKSMFKGMSVHSKVILNKRMVWFGPEVRETLHLCLNRVAIV